MTTTVEAQNHDRQHTVSRRGSSTNARRASARHRAVARTRAQLGPASTTSSPVAVAIRRRPEARTSRGGGCPGRGAVAATAAFAARSAHIATVLSTCEAGTGAISAAARPLPRRWLGVAAEHRIAVADVRAAPPPYRFGRRAGRPALPSHVAVGILARRRTASIVADLITAMTWSITTPWGNLTLLVTSPRLV